MAEGCLNAPNNVKKRTADIKVKDSVDFESLLLSEEILSGLKKCGFERPSPVQLKAIPLGRCGLDLVVQAKSGTGKTCVFSVIALESIMLNSPSTQVLVLAPTREIAVQIWQVIHSVGTDMTRLRCYTFIGGMPLSEDKVKLKKCHIAVGTPGRVRQLIEMKLLNTESIRLFVLDEADKLMEQGFQETINWIFSSLPENKQMLALSATYPESLAKHLTMYMKNPTFVRLNTDDLSLLGIRQYYQTVQFSPLQQKAFEIKSKMLMDLLNAISFQQCLIFSNYQLRAQSLADVLNKEGWPAAYISGSQDQQNRLAAMAKLKTFKCRILISTDLTSRGIDAENVNLIINMDVPHDHATYLHRIGRAGRYGTYGAAITLVSLGKEMADLKTIEGKAKTRILLLPDPVPADLVEASGFLDYSDHIIAVSTAKVTEHEPDEETSAACDMKSGYSDTCEEYNWPSHDNMNNKSAKYSIRSTQDEQDIIPKRETTQTVNEETSDRETSSNKQTSVTIKDYDRVTGETCSSEYSEIRRPVSSICAAQLDASLNLPTLHSLHTFVGHVKKGNVNVLDFTLPLLDDIIGTKRSTSASYADIMADYRQFKNTGKSILPLTSTLCSYDPSAYEIALQKVDMTMNGMCLLSMEKDGMNAAEIVQESDVQSMCIDGKNLVKEEEMLRATSPILAKQVVGEIVTVENGSSVMTCDNAQKMNTVSLLKDNDHSDKQTNSGLDDKIIGFSELNFHFGNTSPSQEARPKIAAMSGNPGMRKSIICTSNRTEDKDIGLEFMKRLQAQHDTDSSENSSSSFESDNDLEEYYRTDTTGSDRQHPGGADKTEDCEGRNASYSYNSSHLPVYQHVREWDAHSEYSSWNWNDPDHPAGNANANYLLDHNIGSYHNMDYYGHYNFNFGGMQPFPHQLWAQCAHLLGSINAMQALQYSSYCHQWYLHHTRCAHLYASHSKKHKTKLKQNLKDA